MTRSRTGRRMLGAVTLSVALVAPIGAGNDAQATPACPRPAPGVIRSAPGSGKTVALTFDDGPGTFTPQILAVLRRYDVRATFFDTGRHDARFPDRVKEIAAEGHLLGDHTWDHDYPSQVRGGWTRAYLGSQLGRTNAQLRRLTGRPVCFFRPPGGFLTSSLTSVAAGRGMSTVLWSVDTEDWKQPGRTTAAATARIVAAARAGLSQSHPIVLMHTAKASHEPESMVSSNRGNTVASLPAIIKAYRSHGYRFVDLLGASGLPSHRYTRLSASSARLTVPAGTRHQVMTAAVTSVTGPVQGKSLHWFSRRVGTSGWTLRGTVTTDRHGKARVYDRPDAATDYTVGFPEQSSYAAAGTKAFSRVRTVTYPTDISVAASATSLVVGESVTLTAKVTSTTGGRPGVTVSVDRIQDGVTDSLGDVVTDAHGRVVLTDAPTADARYVLTVAKRLPYRSGRGEVSVTVTQPPAPPEPTPAP